MNTRIKWNTYGVDYQFTYIGGDVKQAIELVKYVSQTHYGMTPDEIERTVYETLEEQMEHLYRCSGGHLFLSEDDDFEASCTEKLNDDSRCFLMGWHNEHCGCNKEKE